jgi:TRAP-type C4-dicarboxylate transport system permease small subunit
MVRLICAAAGAALRWSLVVAIAVIVAAIAYQVVMRYCFGRAPSWTEELAILMFAWATLDGLALGVREGFHVRLTVILDRLPRGPRQIAERALDVFALLVGAYLAWSGWRYVDATTGGTSAAIAYPVEILHGMAPAAGILVMLFAAERLWHTPPVTDDETHNNQGPAV